MQPTSKLCPTRSRTSARLASAAVLGALFVVIPFAGAAQAATTPPMGTTTAFSVLAGTTITNTGATTIDRSIGVHPGTAITGESLITLGGTAHKADAVALQAKTDLTTAFNQAAGQGPPTAVGPELGGLTLTAGTYHASSELQLTGALTLNGDADDVWVFQAPSTLITASAASVLFSGGANACNVYWQVGSSATLGTTTAFAGTIMAEATITMNTGATIIGRTLARSGAVNLHNNVFTSPDCANDTTVPDATPTPTPTPTPGGTGGTGGTNGGGGGGGDDGTNGTNGGTGGTGGGSQITTVPTGSVDTGYVGPATSSEQAPDSAIFGAMFTIGFGGLALVALRRRRVM